MFDIFHVTIASRTKGRSSCKQSSHSLKSVLDFFSKTFYQLNTIVIFWETDFDLRDDSYKIQHSHHDDGFQEPEEDENAKQQFF